VKAAVIGCGQMGAAPSARLEGLVPGGWLPISHVECLRQVEGVELAALCDMDSALLEARGRHYGITALYTDYRRMLDEVRPDVVTVATRTPPKHDIVTVACGAGVRGIYVEKPLANSIAEADSVLSCAAAAGVTLVYGVNRRYHPTYREARRMLLDGAIGEPIEVVAEHGRAPLFWSHPHTVDLALFLLERTDLLEVQASLDPETVEQRGELHVDSDPVVEHARFTFGSGTSAILLQTGGLSVRVGGTRGTLTVHGDGSYIQLNRPLREDAAYFLDQRFLPTLPGRSATVTALAELVGALDDSGLSPVSSAEIGTGLRMLMGAVWSHLQGSRPVAATDIPQQLVVTGRYGDVYA